MATNATSASKMGLPGIDIDVKQDSGLPTEGRGGYWYELALPVTVRERVIIAVTAALKDKPDWERKVFDESIVSKWRSEALGDNSAAQSQNQAFTTEDEQVSQAGAQDAASTLKTPARQRVVTENLFQYVSLVHRQKMRSS